jgi:hypothetical protein
VAGCTTTGVKLKDHDLRLVSKVGLLQESGRTDSKWVAPSLFDTRLVFEALEKADADFQDPYLTFDPKKDVQDVSLSPLGIVHIYRQYFFELDSFLGTPTGHVWLSPGSTVELVEVSTRKTVTERTIETALETIVARRAPPLAARA